MFAVILTGAKQYLVREGDVLRVEKLDLEAGKPHVFSSVIMTSPDDTTVQVGSPFLPKASVEVMVAAHGKGEKIRVFKMKAKKNQRRTKGHRQPYTELKVMKINS